MFSFKLISYYDDSDWELFGLQEDPHELHNVYAIPEYSDIVNELKDELDRLRNYYGDHEI